MDNSPPPPPKWGWFLGKLPCRIIIIQLTSYYCYSQTSILTTEMGPKPAQNLKNLDALSLREQQLERKVNDGEAKDFCYPASNPPRQFTEIREIY